MTLHLSISSPDTASAIEFFQCIVFLHQNILDILLHNLDDHSTPWCKISIAIPIYLECNLSLILEEILTFQLLFLSSSAVTKTTQVFNMLLLYILFPICSKHLWQVKAGKSLLLEHDTWIGQLFSNGNPGLSLSVSKTVAKDQIMKMTAHVSSKNACCALPVQIYGKLSSTMYNWQFVNYKDQTQPFDIH